MLEYSRNRESPQTLILAEADLARLADVAPTTWGRVLFVENIKPHLISLLGETLDVDPVFFAGHVTTDFPDIEQAPPPPSLALFPSQAAEWGYLYIHYQQEYSAPASSLRASACSGPGMLFCSGEKDPEFMGLYGSQDFKTVSSISLTSIGLVLVDPPIKTVVETTKSGVSKSHPSKPLQRGFEDFAPSTSFTSFRVTEKDQSWDKNSMLGSLLHYFRNQPPGFTAGQPSILSFGYYPMRIALAEWMLYTHVTSRYFKHYEYSLHDIQNRLHDSDIVDLQRWRRRIIQSQHKLKLLAEAIDYWLHQEANKQPWVMMLKDIEYVLSQLGYYGHSLEQMIPVATSMVQLLDSRRSFLEAVSISRLTYIALVFVPLSWVASLFSMSDNYSPGNEHFWVYFATALPVLLLVLLLSTVQWDQFAGKLNNLREFMKWQSRRQRMEVGLA